LPFSPTNSDRSPTKDTDEGLWRVTITSADFDNLLKPLVIGFRVLLASWWEAVNKKASTKIFF
jgi:hypothetical protein